MKLNSVKRFAAQAFDILGVNSAGHYIQRASLFPFIRVVNYHNIPEHLAANFEDHLVFYSSRFANVTYHDLVDFLQDGKWPYDKPGLIISFDDGFRSHFETAAPLLEKHNFTGWFFVPAILCGNENDSLSDDRFMPAEETMTREHLLDLSEKHVIGCHTYTHCRLTGDLPTEKLRYEILDARRSLERSLGRPIKIFCWVGGEEYTYTKAAADLIKQEFDLSFMTNTAVVSRTTDRLQLQRTNIEADNPLWLVRFQISGFMDIAYFPKRSRVNRLTR